MEFVALAGRVFFSAIFILSSFKHFDGSLAGYAESAGVPAFLVPLAGAMILAGGLSVLLGYRARGGAWLIILFLAPVTVAMHRFWGMGDPQAAMQQQVHFMKNLSMLGGALLIAYFGPGPYSFDERRRRLARESGRVLPPLMRRGVGSVTR